MGSLTRADAERGRDSNLQLFRGVGIRFKGREREDVEEYCASEGWIRVAAGKAVDRHGLPITVKLNGEVETWWRDEDEGEGEE